MILDFRNHSTKGALIWVNFNTLLVKFTLFVSDVQSCFMPLKSKSTYMCEEKR